MSPNGSVPRLTWALLGLLLVNALLARRVLVEYRTLQRLRAANEFSHRPPKTVPGLDGYRRDGTRITFRSSRDNPTFVLFRLHAPRLKEELAYWQQVGAGLTTLTNTQFVAYCDTPECAESAEILGPAFEVAAYCSINLSRILSIYDKDDRFIVVDSSRRILADIQRVDAPRVGVLLKQTVAHSAGRSSQDDGHARH